GMVVDHINGNSADNRIENLRVVTPSQNSRNQKKSSAAKGPINGVRFYEKGASWKAEINCNGKTLRLGTFDTAAEAIAARVSAEIVLKFSYRHGKE
ncbi:MAG: HNH endonuclease, partial [Methylococcales bacterium]|nr:HNH endonuclease [Methylococcales bacterium]